LAADQPGSWPLAGPVIRRPLGRLL
jgi:hypothetical protein